MPIRTLPTPLQDTGIWNVVTPQPPPPPEAPPMPMGSAMGQAVGQQIAAPPQPQSPEQSMSAQEQYMAQQIPDQQTNQFSAAPAGTLRNQVENSRQGADSGGYGKLGLGLAAVGLAAVAPEALTAGGPEAGLLERGVGMAARFAATTGIGSEINKATESIPGFENLPRPAKTAALVAPYIAAGPGGLLKKGLEIGGAVLGSEGAQYANKELGSPAPNWMADMLGQGIGSVGLNVLEKKGPAQIARILSEEPKGNRSVEDLLGWDKPSENPKGWDTVGTETPQQSDAMTRALSNEEIPNQTVEGAQARLREIRSRQNEIIKENGGGSRAASGKEYAALEDEKITLQNQIEGVQTDTPSPLLRSVDAEMDKRRNILNDMPTGDIRKGYNDAVDMQSDLSPAERQQQIGDLQLRKKELQSRQDALLDKDGFVPDNAVKAWQYYQEEKRVVDEQLNTGMTKTTKNDPHVMQDTVMYGEELYRRTNGAEGLKPRPNGLKFDVGPQEPAPSDYNAGLGKPVTLSQKVAASRDVTPAGQLPPLQSLMGDVDTIENKGIINKVARTVFGAPNPSVQRETALGIVGTAVQRQKIAVENLTAERMAAWYDPASRTGLGRDIWQLDKDMNSRVVEVATGTKAKVNINKILENPENYLLSPEQDHFVKVVDGVIQSVEDMRQAEGLPSRQLARNPRAPGEPKYFPRNFTEKNGLALPTENSANLRRSGKSMDDLLTEGYKSNDPRAALENYVRDAYEEVSLQQQKEMLMRYGVSPSDLVPATVRIAKQQADEALIKQQNAQRKEAWQTQRLSRNAALKDVAQADRELATAKANLRVVQARINAETTSAKVIQQSMTWGQRLSDARAIVNVAQGIRDDAYDTMHGVPRGKAGAMRMVSNATLQETDRLQRIADKAGRDYERELAAVNEGKARGELESPAYWDDSVVDARKTMHDAEADYRKMQEARGVTNTNLLARDKHSLNMSDPDIIASRDAWRQTQKDYETTLTSAKNAHSDDPEILVGSRGRGIGQNMFFPKRDLEQFEKGLDLANPAPSDKSIASHIGAAGQAVVNTARTISTGADFGIGFIHLLPVAFRDPAAWAQAVAHNYIDAFNPNNFGHFMQAHNETIQALSRNGMGMGGSDLYQATKLGEGTSLGLGSLAEKLPGGAGIRRTAQQVGKQTYGRLGHATEAAQTVAQTLLWESMAPKWTSSESELAHTIKNMTGALDTRALGVSRLGRNFEATFMALSPRLLRSSLALIGDLHYLSSPLDPEKRAIGISALRTLGQFTAGAAAVYVASGLALNKSPADIKKGLDPTSGKQFMSHKIDGQWIGFGGVMRGLIQMTAMAGSAAAPGGRPIEDLWAMNGQRNPVLNFMISRGAPFFNVATQVGEYATGANLSSYNRIDTLYDLYSALGKDILPYTIAGHKEGDSLLGSAANTAGLRTSPSTPAEDKIAYAEQIALPALQAAGQIPQGVHHLEDLGFGESNAITRYLTVHNPGALKDWQEYRRQLGSVYQEKQDEREKIDQNYAGEYDRILKGLNDGSIEPKAAGDALTNARNQERGEFNQLYDDKYKAATAKLKPNDLQQLTNAWFQIPNDVAKGAKTLTPEMWDAVDAKQKNFIDNLQAHDPALAARFQNDLLLRNSVEDAHPLIKAKREVDTASKTYYELPTEGSARQDYLKQNIDLNVQRWYMYGTALETPAAVDQALTRQAKGQVGKFMAAPSFNREVTLAGFNHPINTDLATWGQDKSMINKFLSLNPTQRALAVSAVPNINALSVYWGHSDKLEDDAIKLFTDKMNAHPTPQWQQDGQLISLYYALPATQKDKGDKIHVRASYPQLDAAVALFEETQYGKTPHFLSKAGAAEFYKRTGRNVEHYAVDPPKD